MSAGIVWWRCLYRVLPGSSKAGLGSCLTDHLLISLQKVRGFCFVYVFGGFILFGVFCGVFMARYSPVLPKCCWTGVVDKTGAEVFTRVAGINVLSAGLLVGPVEAH